LDNIQARRPTTHWSNHKRPRIGANQVVMILDE
jgi:hypothetical protein